jgi:hypothetical protein
VRTILPGFIPDNLTCDLVEGVIRFTSEREISPEEAAWTLVALACSGMGETETASRLAKRICSQFDPILGIREPTPIYRHKRLDDYYASTACSTLFCLEGLRSYRSIEQDDSNALTTTEFTGRPVALEV